MFLQLEVMWLEKRLPVHYASNYNVVLTYWLLIFGYFLSWLKVALYHQMIQLLIQQFFIAVLFFDSFDFTDTIFWVTDFMWIYHSIFSQVIHGINVMTLYPTFIILFLLQNMLVVSFVVMVSSNVRRSTWFLLAMFLKITN